MWVLIFGFIETSFGGRTFLRRQNTSNSLLTSDFGMFWDDNLNNLARGTEASIVHSSRRNEEAPGSAMQPQKQLYIATASRRKNKSKNATLLTSGGLTVLAPARIGLPLLDFVEALSLLLSLHLRCTALHPERLTEDIVVAISNYVSVAVPRATW